jgi:hypothetical protein
MAKTKKYRGYVIYLSEYGTEATNTQYEFYNEFDCDEFMGSGRTIAECKEQIDERINKD